MSLLVAKIRPPYLADRCNGIHNEFLSKQIVKAIGTVTNYYG